MKTIIYNRKDNVDPQVNLALNHDAKKGDLISKVVKAGLVMPLAGSLLFGGWSSDIVKGFSPISPPVTPTPTVTLPATPPTEPTPTPITPPVEPTLTPTPTPTATLTPTPIPTDTPIPTPTETPVPDDNTTPVLRTRRLKTGRVAKEYRSTIKGLDQDEGDKLSFEVNNLPDGLELENCVLKRNRWRAHLKCEIKGIPEGAGEYPVELILKDDQGGEVSKSLNLKIREGYEAWWLRWIWWR